MAIFKSIVGGFCLFSLLGSAVIAAPAAVMQVTELVKRVPGDGKTDYIDATFDTTHWPNIAEQNCYAMLCLLSGNRV